MPQFVSVLGAAAASIGSSLRRSIADNPADLSAGQFAARLGYYRLLDLLYRNEIYDDAQMWQGYKARYRLPRTIRPVFNPTRRVVDWYAGHVYSGVWTMDGNPTPDGQPSLIPLAPDTLSKRPAFVIAALQALSWGDWPEVVDWYVRSGAKYGSVFVVVTDDDERRKVYPQIVPLEWVADLDLDATGNVKGYVLSYRARKRDGTPFDFRREVTAESIREIEGRSTTLDVPNPYGFVPAVWVRHRHVGSIFGSPAIDGVIPKIDELNALITAVNNYVHRWHNQPMVFYGGSAPPATIKAGATDDTGVVAEQEAVRWLHTTDSTGHVDPLMREMQIGQVSGLIDALLEEIEADLPEIVMDEQLRSVTGGITGPGADRMMSDVRSRLIEAMAHYDQGTKRLMQMCVAIAGWRVGTGSWGARSALDAEQAKFAGFGLDSFRAGDLDIEILPRPLIPITPMERLLQWQMEKDTLGLSDQEMRRRAGIDDVTSARIDAELAKQQDADAAAFAGRAGAFA